MKLDAKKYYEMRKAASPPSPLLKDCLWAFFVGGAICLLGEGLRTLYAALGFTLTAVVKVFADAGRNMCAQTRKNRAGRASAYPALFRGKKRRAAPRKGRRRACWFDLSR